MNGRFGSDATMQCNWLQQNVLEVPVGRPQFHSLHSRALIDMLQQNIDEIIRRLSDACHASQRALRTALLSLSLVLVVRAHRTCSWILSIEPRAYYIVHIFAVHWSTPTPSSLLPGQLFNGTHRNMCNGRIIMVRWLLWWRSGEWKRLIYSLSHTYVDCLCISGYEQSKLHKLLICYVDVTLVQCALPKSCTTPHYVRWKFCAHNTHCMHDKVCMLICCDIITCIGHTRTACSKTLLFPFFFAQIPISQSETIIEIEGK